MLRKKLTSCCSCHGSSLFSLLFRLLIVVSVALAIDRTKFRSICSSAIPSGEYFTWSAPIFYGTRPLLTLVPAWENSRARKGRVYRH
jgi:hypothetical protein